MLKNFLSRLGSRHRRQSLAYAQPIAALEALESRRLLTVDLGGNSLATATDFGSVNGTRELSDAVSRTDPNDYFRFRIDGQANTRIDLTGLRADADVSLLDGGGRTMAQSTQGGSQSEQITRSLAAGTYFLRVYRYSGDTSYRLSVRVDSAAPTIPDNAGNSTSSARYIGTLNAQQSYSDFVGSADRDDYYRFDLTDRSRFELSLEGLSADADVSLLNSQGSTLASSTRGGNASESINRTLDGGTYFARIYRYSGDTNYRLTLKAELDGPPDGAGNSFEAARNLGTVRGRVETSDFVGNADRADYYRFRLESRSDVRLRLQGLTADADVKLFDASGRLIAGSSLGGNNSEAIDRALDVGDYFALVYPYGGAETNFLLSLDASTQQQGLDLRTVAPIEDREGHVGADYMATAGTALLSPVSGRVIDVRPIDGYGTMAVAIEVTLPSNQTFASELTGTSVTTNRAIFVFGHLRPSRELVDHPSATERFRLGRGELTYGVGSTIAAGQLLGYVETHGYEGHSSGSHVHVTGSDANNSPDNIWRGGGLSPDDPLRARYIRPELAWGLM